MDGNNQQKKILVVEDEQTLRNLYVDILKSEGFQVNEASDGESGHLEMQEGGYDLVLLDLIMPKMDGLQILRKLKETPPKSPIKNIVVLTNLGQEQTVAEAVSLGAKSYMIKSDYTPDQVVAEVKSYLSS